jgi:hypothetical protein
MTNITICLGQKLSPRFGGDPRAKARVLAPEIAVLIGELGEIGVIYSFGVIVSRHDCCYFQSDFEMSD